MKFTGDLKSMKGIEQMLMEMMVRCTPKMNLFFMKAMLASLSLGKAFALGLQIFRRNLSRSFIN